MEAGPARYLVIFCLFYYYLNDYYTRYYGSLFL